ncbi:Leu/Phe/Val dehydrogenase [Oricola cellulosilytica]|uniref:Amino acid dehydrogenase n=1 Tax=Oricola cellulosilytica TaxID=1429082 RepID=A0A4R0PG57_9HYPH|nr:amino acid dehydrogenase [Oricola cellulosilytica]TCD15913.1 amino acid dehydrogenase [Oricola cellulosilytica]
MLQSVGHTEITGGTGTLSIRDITCESARIDAFDSHEQIFLGEDPSRGLKAIVAIHNTRLGPALGGTRIWPHETFDAALTDVLRLSRGMTLKAAISGLPFGGGKALIVADARTAKTPELLDAYAEMLLALKDRFWTAEDVGMTLADADYLRARTPNVSGTSSGGGGNPSPITAEGVFLGLKAAVEHRHGSEDLTGLKVAVQGLGAVGWALCERLHAAGAALIVADIDADRAGEATSEFGARKCAADAIHAADADIFAPCALGGMLNGNSIPELKAGIIAGSANNQLAREEDAVLLKESGILYAPDYVINSGGLINVAAELEPGGYEAEAAFARLRHIPETLADIFHRAEATGMTTNEVAEALALERIAAAS